MAAVESSHVWASQEDTGELSSVLAPLGYQVLSLPDSEANQRADISTVVSAIEQNSSAVREMAHACMALVAAMADADDDGERETAYNLDGSPVDAG